MRTSLVLRRSGGRAARARGGRATLGSGFLVALLLALTACSAGGDGSGDQSARAGRGALEVVASFYPLYEAAQRVGGDLVEVSNLTAAGAEPHDLELTPDQVDRIEDADVVLYFGRGFQPGVEEVAARAQGEAVDVLEDLPLPAGPAAGGGSADPHVWLDLELMAGIVDRVQDALVAADPGGRTGFAARADVYRGELAELDSRFRSSLATCRRTTIVTSHAAFGHLARRYGLVQESIAGFSPEVEPDPKRFAALADLVRRTGTTTIYSETLVSARIADTLAREAGVGTAVLNPLEGLTREQQKAGASFLSVMADNLAALVRGLGCG